VATFVRQAPLDKVIKDRPDEVCFGVTLRKSRGIEKGKPFRPDETTQGILNAAADEARARLDLKYETMFSPYYEGRRAAPAA
jgi:hypothetical protein